MSSKDWIRPIHTAVAQSLVTSFQTAPIHVQRMDRLVYKITNMANVSANTGTFNIQIRDIVPGSGKTADTSGWADLSVSQTLTSANTTFILQADTVATECRLNFVVAGGAPTGTCDIFFSATQLGG